MVGSRWLNKLKDGINMDELVKYKARLIAQWFTQIEGVDYNEIFSHVVKYSSIRLLISLVAHFDIHLEQMNAKIVFLHEKHEEKIYMK